jgi:hypothetical protein
MKNSLRKILFLLLIGALMLALAAGAFRQSTQAAETPEDKYVKGQIALKHTLRFNSDGKFKILIFSDIQDSYPLDAELVRNMNKLLDTEKPDLVLLGGDNHCGDADAVGGETRMTTYLTAMSEPMEKRKIPWAQVYGNHAEGGYGYNLGYTRMQQQKIFESFAYNISKAGSVYGVGNYVLPILRSDSDKIAFNVFMIDSHDYLYNYKRDIEDKVLLRHNENGQQKSGIMIYSGNTYDVVHMEQIKWYWDTSVALEKYNGSKIAAMMLLHIPLYEWNYVLNNKSACGYTGKQGETPCTPEANSGLFQACYERGDVKAIICGHDHLNDFSGKYMGITLAYTPTIGAPIPNYLDKSITGARIVEIDQNDPFNFVTYMVHAKDVG